MLCKTKYGDFFNTTLPMDMDVGLTAVIQSLCAALQRNSRCPMKIVLPATILNILK